MSTGEDEPSSGLNGRLRPRKINIPSPKPTKTVRKQEIKLNQERKSTSTPSKTSTIKSDDLNISDVPPASQVLCSFCEKGFVSKQAVVKHARRVHLSTSKQDLTIGCIYCNHEEAESNDIIRHMVDSHPNQYFACLDCHSRFSSTAELAEHKLNLCEKQKLQYRNKLRQKPSSKKNLKSYDDDEGNDIGNSGKDFEHEHGFNGVVISCELKPSRIHDEGDIEGNITTNLILPPSKNLGNASVIEKNAVIVLDDLQWNKRIPPNFSFNNTDADQILSRLGVVQRSSRTGETNKRDWFKIIDETNQKFERCFETSFYSKVASNVQENLTKFLDGSFNFNPDPDNTIKTRKAKNSVPINTAEGFPILLAFEQYSRNVFEGYLPRSIAPKHKWKWDNLEHDKNLLSPEQIKRDSHVNNCIITLVSSLDIWTQLCMRQKFEDKFSSSPLKKKAEKQNIIGKELKEILEKRELPTSSSQIIKYTSKPPLVRDDLEFPASLGLTPAAPTRDYKPAVLSGEWVRPRCYVCCACGAQATDSRALTSHTSTQHPNAQIQHYEIVGDHLHNADILKHLYVPPSQAPNRTRPLRGFRECTKCNKSISLEDLHQHMLDCAGDTPTVRRKCRSRAFGVRKRRPRLPDNTIRQKMRKDIRTRHNRKNHMRPRPKIKSEVGDAETIRKMIADLPAKRHRVMVNPMNPMLRPRRKLDRQRNKIMMKRSSADELKKKLVGELPKTASTDTEHPNKKLTTNSEDNDGSPLRMKVKRVVSQVKRYDSSIQRKTTINMNKKRIVAVKKNLSKPKSDLSTNTHDSGVNSLIIQSSTGNNNQSVNVNSNYNTREHSNRSNNRSNNNRDNQQPGSSRQNGGGSSRDSFAASPNVPLKHSIASLTANSETHDKAVQFHHLFLVQQECNNINQHVQSGQKILFENEAVVTKLDKPPLHFNHIAISDVALQKSKANKPRKGLNDCIAMLKNKLVEPPKQVSVQCGSDEPLTSIYDKTLYFNSEDRQGQTTAEMLCSPKLTKETAVQCVDSNYQNMVCKTQNESISHETGTKEVANTALICTKTKPCEQYDKEATEVAAAIVSKNESLNNTTLIAASATIIPKTREQNNTLKNRTKSKHSGPDDINLPKHRDVKHDIDSTKNIEVSCENSISRKGDIEHTKTRIKLKQSEQDNINVTKQKGSIISKSKSTNSSYTLSPCEKISSRIEEFEHTVKICNKTKQTSQQNINTTKQKGVVLSKNKCTKNTNIVAQYENVVSQEKPSSKPVKENVATLIKKIDLVVENEKQAEKHNVDTETHKTTLKVNENSLVIADNKLIISKEPQTQYKKKPLDANTSPHLLDNKNVQKYYLKKNNDPHTQINLGSTHPKISPTSVDVIQAKINSGSAHPKISPTSVDVIQAKINSSSAPPKISPTSVDVIQAKINSSSAPPKISPISVDVIQAKINSSSAPPKISPTSVRKSDDEIINLKKNLKNQTAQDLGTQMPVQEFSLLSEIPPAHCNVNFESILTAPLDLSGRTTSTTSSVQKIHQAQSYSSTYETYETLDLSNKNSSCDMLTNDFPIPQDDVVDLSIKHVPQSLEWQEMHTATDLSLGSDHIPKDLSLKNKRRSLSLDVSQNMEKVKTVFPLNTGYARDICGTRVNLECAAINFSLNETDYSNLPTDLSNKEANDSNKLNKTNSANENAHAGVNSLRKVVKDTITDNVSTKNDKRMPDFTTRSQIIPTRSKSVDKRTCDRPEKVRDLSISQDTDATINLDQDSKLQAPQFEIGVPIASKPNTFTKANETTTNVNTSTSTSFNRPIISEQYNHYVSSASKTSAVTEKLLLNHTVSQERRENPVSKPPSCISENINTSSILAYNYINRGIVTPANKYESTTPVYTLGNACISVTKIESASSVSLTNILLSVPGNTITNTTSVYTLAGTTIGTPLNYGSGTNSTTTSNEQGHDTSSSVLNSNNIINEYEMQMNKSINNESPKSTKELKEKRNDVEEEERLSNFETNLEQDPETARKIALLPKELVEILGTMPVDHRNQLLNVLPQYVSTSSSTTPTTPSAASNTNIDENLKRIKDSSSVPFNQVIAFPKPEFLLDTHMPLNTTPLSETFQFSHTGSTPSPVTSSFLLTPPTPQYSEKQDAQKNDSIPLNVSEENSNVIPREKPLTIQVDHGTSTPEISTFTKPLKLIDKDSIKNSTIDLTLDDNTHKILEENTPLREVALSVGLNTSDNSSNNTAVALVNTFNNAATVKTKNSKATNDKTASLRAVRIKTQSKRQKSSLTDNILQKMAKETSVLTIIHPDDVINDMDSTLLAIQQDEISSTQHAKKFNLLESQIPSSLSKSNADLEKNKSSKFQEKEQINNNNELKESDLSANGPSHSTNNKDKSKIDCLSPIGTVTDLIQIRSQSSKSDIFNVTLDDKVCNINSFETSTPILLDKNPHKSQSNEEIISIAVEDSEDDIPTDESKLAGTKSKAVGIVSQESSILNPKEIKLLKNKHDGVVLNVTECLDKKNKMIASKSNNSAKNNLNSDQLNKDSEKDIIFKTSLDSIAAISKVQNANVAPPTSSEGNLAQLELQTTKTYDVPVALDGTECNSEIMRSSMSKLRIIDNNGLPKQTCKDVFSVKGTDSDTPATTKVFKDFNRRRNKKHSVDSTMHLKPHRIIDELPLKLNAVVRNKKGSQSSMQKSSNVKKSQLSVQPLKNPSVIEDEDSDDDISLAVIVKLKNRFMSEENAETFKNSPELTCKEQSVSSLSKKSQKSPKSNNLEGSFLCSTDDNGKENNSEREIKANNNSDTSVTDVQSSNVSLIANDNSFGDILNIEAKTRNEKRSRNNRRNNNVNVSLKANGIQEQICHKSEHYEHEINKENNIVSKNTNNIINIEDNCRNRPSEQDNTRCAPTNIVEKVTTGNKLLDTTHKKEIILEDIDLTGDHSLSGNSDLGVDLQKECVNEAGDIRKTNTLSKQVRKARKSLPDINIKIQDKEHSCNQTQIKKAGMEETDRKENDAEVSKLISCDKTTKLANVQNDVSIEKLQCEQNLPLPSTSLPEDVIYLADTPPSIPSTPTCEETVTPLRRSRRGKSLFSDSDTLVMNTLNSDSVVEQKAPLTKKQLIFSKMLLDAENHIKSIDCDTINSESLEHQISSDTQNKRHINDSVFNQDPTEGKTKNKRKKSPQSTKNCKKKKILDNKADSSFDVAEKQPDCLNISDNLILHSHEKYKLENQQDVNENVTELVEMQNNIVDDLKFTSQVSDITIKSNSSLEKRKSTSSPIADPPQSPKPKKTRGNNNKNITAEMSITKEKIQNNLISMENIIASNKTRAIACYNKTVPARRVRSKSVVIGTTTSASYDPYDIDLEDMNEFSEFLNRKESFKNAVSAFKSAKGKTSAINKPESSTISNTTPLDFIDAIPSTSNAGIKSKTNSDIETVTIYKGGTLSDSDDSSKSDVPLKKYAEEKEKKLLELGHSKDVKRKNYADLPAQALAKSKTRRKSKRNTVPDKEDNKNQKEAEDQLRSEQFMESFGFFSERKPRKSNLLASKKISETLHIIANETDEVYFGLKERNSKKRNENRRTVTEQYTYKEAPEKKMNKNTQKNNSSTVIEQRYCNICQKEFRRSDNYLRHQMTLIHVSKLSEVEFKIKTTPTEEEPNYLIALKQQIGRLKVLQIKLEKRKRKKLPISDFILPTLQEIAADVKRSIRQQQLSRRGLSRDEALFLDCCELLKESHKSDANNPEKPGRHCNSSYCVRASVEELERLEKRIDDEDNGFKCDNDGDVDSITAQNILESEEVRNLENDLISGLKEAASASNLAESKAHSSSYHHSLNDVKLDISEKDTRAVAETQGATKESNTNKAKKVKNSEVKDKMYPDVIIDSIDLFEDKFDKIKRKCRSQAAAAKQLQTPVEQKEQNTRKNRKRSEKKKEKKTSKKNVQNIVLTKGALKGFDGIKVSISTSDINITRIVPPAKKSTKKKKKNTSKKKRDRKSSEVSKKCDTDHRSKESSQKKVDVYEFMDTDDAEVFDFRPSTLMERFKSINNKETPSTSKAAPPVYDDVEISSDSVSDGDDFVYMSDDYVCSDEETESSLMSCELGNNKTIPELKKNLPLKRKDTTEKNAVMGKIFKNNAVRSEKKSPKEREGAVPSANLDQLFDSLLEDEPKPSTLAKDTLAANKDKLPKERDYDALSPNKNEVSHPSYDSIKSEVKFEDEKIKSPVPFDQSLVPSLSPKKGKSLTTPNSIIMAQKSTDDIYESKITSKIQEIKKYVPPAQGYIHSPQKKYDIAKGRKFGALSHDYTQPSLKKYDTTEENKRGIACNDTISSQKHYDATEGKKSDTTKGNKIDAKTHDFTRQEIALQKKNEYKGKKVKETAHDYFQSCQKINDVTTKFDESFEEFDIDPSTNYSSDTDDFPYHRPKSKNKLAKNKLPAKKREKDRSTSFDSCTEQMDLGNLSDDAGVARQRVRRKCAVGKQNVLAETWSSESEPDGVPPRPNSAESVVAGGSRKKKGRKKESQPCVGRRVNTSKIGKKHDESRVNSRRVSLGIEGSASSGNRSGGAAVDAAVAGPSHAMATFATPSSSKSRPRPTGYYWSEGDDEQEHLQQHGWIVGDSHKKLVTMLAHAKGRKRNNDDKRHDIE